MRQLVIAIRNYNRENYKKIIDAIVMAGFENVFIEWYNDDIILQQNILNYVKEKNLKIVFAHLGYQKSNALWEEGNIGEEEIKRYINDIKLCKENKIDLVVLHPTLGYDAPQPNSIGIERINKIVSYAEKENVRVAFENVELKGYLEYILNNIKSENLGICFDVGHCNLFFDGEFDTEKFKNKVFAIHLHDNYKSDDDHNLPFDGSINWDKVIKQINDMNYNGYVIIESGYNKYYSNISIDEYYKKAYERAIELRNLYNLHKK